MKLMRAIKRARRYRISLGLSADSPEHPSLNQDAEGESDESDESDESNHSSLEDECGGDSDDSKIVSMV